MESWNHEITVLVFQMGVPILIALVLAIKALGSALLLRIKPSSGISCVAWAYTQAIILDDNTV